jgi:hypothetical protein
VRPDRRPADSAQRAGHPVDVPLRSVNVEHECRRDQFVAPPPDSAPVLALHTITGLDKQR